MIKDNKISFRVDRKEKELLKFYAKANKCTVANLIRSSLNEYLKIDLELE